MYPIEWISKVKTAAIFVISGISAVVIRHHIRSIEKTVMYALLHFASISTQGLSESLALYDADDRNDHQYNARNHERNKGKGGKVASEHARAILCANAKGEAGTKGKSEQQDQNILFHVCSPFLLLT